MSNIKDMTLEELLAVPYSKTRGEIGIFTGFIIVPNAEGGIQHRLCII